MALLLTFLIGVGGDGYVRREALATRNCYGCGNLYCTAVDIADRPLGYLRAVWIMLTEE
jgi:hypothetical protein